MRARARQRRRCEAAPSLLWEAKPPAAIDCCPQPLRSRRNRGELAEADGTSSRGGLECKVCTGSHRPPPCARAPGSCRGKMAAVEVGCEVSEWWNEHGWVRGVVRQLKVRLDGGTCWRSHTLAAFPTLVRREVVLKPSAIAHCCVMSAPPSTAEPRRPGGRLVRPAPCIYCRIYRMTR